MKIKLGPVSRRTPVYEVQAHHLARAIELKGPGSIYFGLYSFHARTLILIYSPVFLLHMLKLCSGRVCPRI